MGVKTAKVAFWTEKASAPMYSRSEAMVYCDSSPQPRRISPSYLTKASADALGICRRAFTATDSTASRKVEVGLLRHVRC